MFFDRYLSGIFSLRQVSNETLVHPVKVDENKNRQH